MIRKLLAKFLLIASLFTLTGCDTELISNVSERQANEIIALLEQNNIDAQKIRGDKGVFSIRVDKNYMSDSVELLTAHNLPSAEDVEIADQFPADAMVSTPLGEKARLISAVEQRLGQTIRELDNVTTARVHLSYPLEGNSDAQALPSSVSVLIIYKNAINEAEYIDKVKRLVKNSISNIQYENISVVIFKRTDTIKPSKPAPSTPSWLVIAAGLLIVILCAIFVIFIFSFKEGKLARKPKQQA